MATETHIEGIQDQLRSMFDDAHVPIEDRMPSPDTYQVFERLGDFEAEWHRIHRDDADARYSQEPFFHRDTGKIYLPPYSSTTTIAHETLHGATDAAFHGRVPDWINEGVTELFTIEAMGTGTESGYSDNVEIARMIRDAVGDVVLRRAYFHGDVEGLDAALAASTRFETPLEQLRNVFAGVRGTAQLNPDTLDNLRWMLAGTGTDQGPSW